ncbi:MAG: DUF4416 family protein [Desulfovibrionaceae bacterium]|nr:DUF4416 family protein [Desulfovibrionaceae bacterium]
MSIPRDPAPAQLVLSVLSADWESFWPGLKAPLQDLFGPLDHESEALAFTQTEYYDRELGSPIFRRFLGFERLQPMDGLARIKLLTNGLELEAARPSGDRVFNLDPGFLTLERLVLATGKNFGHRIYLGGGIWADLTLVFRAGAWQDLAWTFPDYRTQAVKSELTRLRQSYKLKLTALAGEAGLKPGGQECR